MNPNKAKKSVRGRLRKLKATMARVGGPPISRDADKNWDNDNIQFPRLISELQAAGVFTAKVINDLKESMDLTEAEIFQIIERADGVWEKVKSRTRPPV